AIAVTSAPAEIANRTEPSSGMPFTAEGRNLLQFHARHDPRTGVDAQLAEIAGLAVGTLYGDPELADAAGRLLRHFRGEFGQKRLVPAYVVDEFVAAAGHLRHAQSDFHLHVAKRRGFLARVHDHVDDHRLALDLFDEPLGLGFPDIAVAACRAGG